MSNDDFNLDKIWQQQDVTKVNVQSLKRQWWLMRMKQYLYIMLDGLAVMSVPLVLWFFPKELSTFEGVWIGVVFLFVCIWFFYLLWLRRFSLGFNSETATTSDFIQRVKLQYQQNIKIAYVNKVLCYITPMFFVGYAAFAFWGDFVEQQELVRKAKVMLILNIVCMPLMWLWMHKRQLKFKRLLEEFESQSPLN
ncbi:hypothetical protein Q4574_13670 [Aliiglaciecola sp. 3_MG-2023]|uniref:hypothetical protein n=1 Tax=Aliiglaciecola sp. 3_MG-2023 TaxID=3062644 RepID=UPI0026E3E28C|nr:hypothetical protein [Aliiglaciecola sp. 3_MG-2023]MDO6694338.1 hypothetical protein [Aliiglaciecola sp. 3_MG-2023]